MDDFKQSMVCTAQYSKSVRLCTLLVFRCALTRSSGHVLIKRYWRSHRSPARCRQFLCQFSWRCEFGSRCICPQALQKETYGEITHPVIQVSVSTFYTSLTYFINWCLSLLRTQQLILWNTIKSFDSSSLVTWCNIKPIPPPKNQNNIGVRLDYKYATTYFKRYNL